ncbi:MAG: hypothetical protein H7Z12_14400 [Rhodospirillaceae bacterium]|nr:hypothetical protein [Rhodospirillales bacterium]
MVIAVSRLCVMVALSALAAPADAVTCPSPGKEIAQPTVRLATELPVPTYANNLNRKQLAAIGHGNTLDSHHAGLTQTRTAFSVRPSLNFFRLSDGKICAQVTEVEASWRATQLHVDIAREYRVGTCPYREVWEHESQHVQIAKDQFAIAEQKLRSRLAVQAGAMRPFIISGTPEQAAREVAARMMAAMQPVLDAYRVDSERANAAIDTQENYRRVTARCADW